MPKFNVGVTALITVTVEADDAQQAQGRADRFVEWMSPTYDQVLDYLEDHPEGIDPEQTGAFSVEGDSDVEEAES